MTRARAHLHGVCVCPQPASPSVDAAALVTLTPVTRTQRRRPPIPPSPCLPRWTCTPETSFPSSTSGGEAFGYGEAMFWTRELCKSHGMACPSSGPILNWRGFVQSHGESDISRGWLQPRSTDCRGCCATSTQRVNTVSIERERMPFEVLLTQSKSGNPHGFLNRPTAAPGKPNAPKSNTEAIHMPARDVYSDLWPGQSRGVYLRKPIIH